ncbi:neuronal pentraxin-2-like [Montipora foliosa]|uniref:neuronal pentraxin-2-like n=1 Tax=Montipora foliosa TaxID=591990 RepID=UPI0035F1D9E0
MNYFTSNRVTQQECSTPRYKIPVSAFTACFWMKTDDETNEGTPLSYSTTSTSNELLVHNYQNFLLCINDDERDTTVAAAGGRWHHICATWENNAGSWQLFKDGVLKKMAKILKRHNILSVPVDPCEKIHLAELCHSWWTVGGGVLVLSEEQDEPGSRFDSLQSFRGKMTGVHLWDFVLHHHDVNLFNTCQTGRGNVLAWSHFIDAQRGDGVTVTAMLPC